ncbi:MAG: aminotransferase class V [Chloroflexi bacterium RBG_16_54_18]|nr:MAG: aminotransferase class V [Chloroflexi bacterium RBG_16_54_18]
MPDYKKYFLLDPDVTYLNHGSFGACPRPVFEKYQDWQRQLESQPVEFLGRKFGGLLSDARERLADFLGVNSSDLVYFPNPTTAINMAARNIARLVEGYSGVPLRPGDEILSSDHEYGALDRTWRYFCAQNGNSYVNRRLPLPLLEPSELVEHFWKGVNDKTRVVYLSHITSPTALILPAQEIARRARETGILSIIDGAHAPGQIDLDLQSVGADLYAGACHKWLMAPKGSAFLYVRSELQAYLDPLVISWGYLPESGYGSGLDFIDRHEWQGTRDIAAYLSVPAAIEFQQVNNWEKVRQECHRLAVEARRRLTELTGLTPICGEDSFRQMFAARLPDDVDTDILARRLYEEFHIEVPAIHSNSWKILRVSIQGYNSEQDVERLIHALKSLVFS